MAVSSASTTITFSIVGGSGAGADASLRVIMDDAANNGKNSFTSGETANFIVITNPANLAFTVDTTMGTISGGAEKTFTITNEMKQFIKASTAELDYMPSGTVTTSWVGRDGGTISVAGAVLTASTPIVGVLSCSYSAKGKGYALSGVTVPSGMDSIEVLVVVSAT